MNKEIRILLDNTMCQTPEHLKIKAIEGINELIQHQSVEFAKWTNANEYTYSKVSDRWYKDGKSYSNDELYEYWYVNIHNKILTSNNQQ